jgi:peptidoglycan DL-endopeptidase CwlO
MWSISVMLVPMPLQLDIPAKMATNGIALGAIAVGAVFLYSAVKGKSILASAQAIITGKAPSTVPQTLGIANVSAGTNSTPAATNSALANFALASVGHAYLYGGAPGVDGSQPWDCSSACNWWVGKEGGQSIPGYPNGSYTGAEHGPSTVSWMFFGTAIGSNPNDAQPGDLCVWQTHMGMAIGNGNMVSALNPADGTKMTSIVDGAPFLEALVVRRLP